MKLKWGLIGILIGILSACQSSNQPMDITYPQPSINIPAEGQKPPIDSEVEIKTPVLNPSDFLLETPMNNPNDVPAKQPIAANNIVGKIWFPKFISNINIKYINNNNKVIN